MSFILLLRVVRDTRQHSISMHKLTLEGIALNITIDGSDHIISASTESEENWELVQKWMTRCINEHPDCCPNN